MGVTSSTSPYPFGSPGHAFRVGRTLLGMWYAFMLTYRVEILLWMIATMLPLIMMGVWIQAGASGLFPDITAVSVARYFLAVFVIRQMTVCWVVYEFEFQVNSGRLSSALLHPIDPIWRFITMHLGEQFARLPFFVAVFAIAVALYPAALRGDDGSGWWAPAWWRVGLFVGLVYAAFLLRFMIQYTISMLAFWFERVAAIEQVTFIPYLYLSGMLFPLEVLPGPIRELVLLTPFPYLLWFPAKLLVDGDVAILPGIATLGVWLLVFTLLNRVMWRIGLKRYSAMGA